jgi:nitroreductase
MMSFASRFACIMLLGAEMSVTNTVAKTAAEAILTRRAVRAFTQAPVERATVERILKVASNAPNGSNIQPWRAYVVHGAHRDKLCADIMAADDADAPGYEEEYQYYPTEWFEPYVGRRRQLGKALYGLVGVAKGDLKAMKAQQARNYVFFDAPVGLFFSLHKHQQYGAWIDMGTFLQSVMVATRGEGLHSCPQQSFSKYHKIVRQHVPIPEDHILVCGMAMGYADTSAAVNQLVPERVPLEEYTTFLWD